MSPYQQGVLDYENRAAEFDFQNRFTLLDFDARDVSLLMRYIPPGRRQNPETYRIEAGASDMTVVRGKEKPAPASMQATLDLTRSAAPICAPCASLPASPAAKKRGEESHSIELRRPRRLRPSPLAGQSHGRA